MYIVQCMSPLNLPLNTMLMTDMGSPRFAKIPKRIHITTRNSNLIMQLWLWYLVVSTGVTFIPQIAQKAISNPKVGWYTKSQNKTLNFCTPAHLSIAKPMQTTVKIILRLVRRKPVFILLSQSLLLLRLTHKCGSLWRSQRLMFPFPKTSLTSMPRINIKLK